MSVSSSRRHLITLYSSIGHMPSIRQRDFKEVGQLDKSGIRQAS